MASTIQLSRSLSYVSCLAQLRPQTGVGGFALEPGLSEADWVRQFILAPPFAWRFNRATTSFTINNTTQDYVKSGLSNFGFLERASITDGANLFKELEIRTTIQIDGIQNEPTHLAVMTDDGAGNIGFRVFPQPATNYTVYVTYQKAANLFAALTDTWAPIPDYFSYLYNQGLIAKSLEQANDEKFALEMQIFFKQVIAANNGLTESQINLFMDTQIATQREISEKVGNSKLAGAARGMFQ